MKRIQCSLYLIAIMLSGCVNDTGQATEAGIGTLNALARDTSRDTERDVAETEIGSDPDRVDRIQENLEYHLRKQLQGNHVTVSEIEEDIIDGFDGGTLKIGTQTFQFITTKDDTNLFIVAAGPFDASLSKAEIAAASEEEQRLAAQDAKQRSGELNDTIRAQNLPVRGRKDAPVTIVEFSDFECPFCQQAFDVVEQVLQKYPDDVRFAYMQFPLDMHPWAKPAAIASLCTAQQDADAFWKLHDSYFRNQKEINPENVLEQSRDFLSESGLDMTAWSDCTENTGSTAYASASRMVEGSIQMGLGYGITGTPGFFINGEFIRGVPPMEMIEGMIEKAMHDVQ